MKILVQLFILVVFMMFCMTYLGSKVGMLISSPNNMAVLVGVSIGILSIVTIMYLGFTVVKSIVKEIENE